MVPAHGLRSLHAQAFGLRRLQPSANCVRPSGLPAPSNPHAFATPSGSCGIRVADRATLTPQNTQEALHVVIRHVLQSSRRWVNHSAHFYFIRMGGIPAARICLPQPCGHPWPRLPVALSATSGLSTQPQLPAVGWLRVWASAAVRPKHLPQTTDCGSPCGGNIPPPRVHAQAATSVPSPAESAVCKSGG